MLTALRRTPNLSSTATVTNSLEEHTTADRGSGRSTNRRSNTKVRSQYVVKPRSVEERLKEVSERSLSGWTTGPDATTLEDIAARTSLHQRHLEPTRMTLSQCKVRLARQARGAPVPPISRVPILLGKVKWRMRRITRLSDGCTEHNTSVLCWHTWIVPVRPMFV